MLDSIGGMLNTIAKMAKIVMVLFGIYVMVSIGLLLYFFKQGSHVTRWPSLKCLSGMQVQLLSL